MFGGIRPARPDATTPYRLPARLPPAPNADFVLCASQLFTSDLGTTGSPLDKTILKVMSQSSVGFEIIGVSLEPQSERSIAVRGQKECQVSTHA